MPPRQVHGKSSPWASASSRMYASADTEQEVRCPSVPKKVAVKLRPEDSTFLGRATLSRHSSVSFAQRKRDLARDTVDGRDGRDTEAIEGETYARRFR